MSHGNGNEWLQHNDDKHPAQAGVDWVPVNTDLCRVLLPALESWSPIFFPQWTIK